MTSVVELKNGNIISGSYDGSIKIWNVETRECVATLLGHKGIVFSVAETQNGEIVSGINNKLSTLKILK